MAVGSMYECDLGDNTKRNFYVLSINQDTIDLIMDRNITQGTSTPTMTWNDAMAYFNNGDGIAVKNSWTKVKGIGLPSAQAIADAGGITGWDYSTATVSNGSYFGVNSTSDPGISVKSPYNWLYGYTQGCASHGCQNETSLESPEALGYWTKDLVQNDSNNAWHVTWYGHLGRNWILTSNYDGVRPVVTLDKIDLN